MVSLSPYKVHYHTIVLIKSKNVRAPLPRQVPGSASAIDRLEKLNGNKSNLRQIYVINLKNMPKKNREGIRGRMALAAALHSTHAVNTVNTRNYFDLEQSCTHS